MDLYAAVRELVEQQKQTAESVTRLTRVVSALAETQLAPPEGTGELRARVERLERWVEDHSEIQRPERHNRTSPGPYDAGAKRERG